MSDALVIDTHLFIQRHLQRDRCRAKREFVLHLGARLIAFLLLGTGAVRELSDGQTDGVPLVWFAVSILCAVGLVWGYAR